MASIQLENVDFGYGGEKQFRMHIPHVELAAGERVAIVGPSGSGKTTLLGLLAGILVPQSGRIQVGDVAISQLGDSARRRFRINHIGQVFQAFELLHYLTVFENVLLSRTIDSAGDEAARKRANELLASVGLEDKARKHPAELSHGEKQRVAVCRAMLNSPRLLLADEPTGNLDAANKQNVVDLLIQQARENESTLLMVTHDRSLLASFRRIIDIEALLGSGP